MFSRKFGLDASLGPRLARTAAALEQARVVAAGFGRSGRDRGALASRERVTRLASVQTLSGESRLGARLPVWSGPADTRTELPTLAFRGAH